MNKSIKMTTPPDVQAIFDAMDAFLTSDGGNNCNASEFIDGTAKRYSVNIGDATGGGQSYTLVVPFSKVVLTPASAQLSPGGVQQFAVTATKPDGTVDATPPVFSISPSDLGAIEAGGTYTAPLVMPFQSAVTVRADVGQAFGTASVLLLVE